MEFYTYQQVQESAQALREKLSGFQSEVLLILGSGLGALADEVESPIAVPYSEVPHMKRSTAPGHKGRTMASPSCRLRSITSDRRLYFFRSSTASSSQSFFVMPASPGRCCSSPRRGKRPAYRPAEGAGAPAPPCSARS